MAHYYIKYTKRVAYSTVFKTVITNVYKKNPLQRKEPTSTASRDKLIILMNRMCET